MSAVDQVRRFNRFYTRKLGLLGRYLPASEFSLPEARVIYELAQGGERTAADICRALGMDKAHVSRIVARLRDRRLLSSRTSPDHGRHRLLSLTDAGDAVYQNLVQAARSQIGEILAPLGFEARRRLVHAMRDIEEAFDAAPPEPRPAVIRGLEPGDLGAVIRGQARLYTGEYGWDWTFEGLVAGIAARYVAEHDPAYDDAWIAELDGEVVGSVFLMRGDEAGTAKLRMLYVDATARGHGVGRRLVAACIDRARGLGYRRVTLWTNDVLDAARLIYEAAGFRLVDEAPHHSFGVDLVGQTWTLDLDAGGPPPASRQT